MTVEEIKPFNAIKYTTSYGENCTATKKVGVVTIQGDKNGVRQMPLDKFMEAFIKDQSKKTLERQPAKDTVSFSGNYKEKSIYEDLKVKNGFFSGKRTVKGNLAGKELDLQIKTNFWGNKTILSGTIDGRPVDLVMKKDAMEGQLSDVDRDLAPALKMMSMDKRSYDNEMAMMAFLV